MQYKMDILYIIKQLQQIKITYFMRKLYHKIDLEMYYSMYVKININIESISNHS